LIEVIELGQDGLGRREIGVAKLTPQGGGIMRHLDLKPGTVGLDKFEVLAVATQWLYHEVAPSWRAQIGTIGTRLILAQVGVKH
jgi:hypothetical protein